MESGKDKTEQNECICGHGTVLEGCLTRVLNEMLAREERRARLGSLEEVGVVAALAQLHDDVQ